MSILMLFDIIKVFFTGIPKIGDSMSQDAEDLDSKNEGLLLERLKQLSES